MAAKAPLKVYCAPVAELEPKRRPVVGFSQNPSAALILGLQRSAGNAAVARQLARQRSSRVGPKQAGVVELQRCGPTPCNCSDDERADYAATHPEEHLHDQDGKAPETAQAPPVRRHATADHADDGGHEHEHILAEVSEQSASSVGVQRCEIVGGAATILALQRSAGNAAVAAFIQGTRSAVSDQDPGRSQKVAQAEGDHGMPETHSASHFRRDFGYGQLRPSQQPVQMDSIDHERPAAIGRGPLRVSQQPILMGPIDDECERDADHVALGIARSAAGSDSLSSIPSNPQHAPPSVYSVMASPGRSLDAPTRAYFEPRLGVGLQAVRIHDDPAAMASASEVSARAYTVGTDIVLADGSYRHDDPIARAVLAHELAHVTQQVPGRPVLRRFPSCRQLLGTGDAGPHTGPGVPESSVQEFLAHELGRLGRVEREFPVPAGSQRPLRTDGRDDSVIEPQIIDEGILGWADIALRADPSRVEFLEVKKATWPLAVFAEIQLLNYVHQAKSSIREVDRLWQKRGPDIAPIKSVRAMPTVRYATPQKPRVIDGQQVMLAWCRNGVIVFKPLNNTKKKKPKDKEPKDKGPGPSESQLLKLGEALLPILAAAGLLDIALAMAGVLGALVSSPLVALAAVVLGIALFWDKLEWLGSKVAGMARRVWDAIAGLADLVRGKLMWILGKLSELGIKLAELGSWLAGRIAWLAGKLTEGLTWIARSVGRKIASAAEAIWDWLTGSDVEPMVPNIEVPDTKEPTHCAAVAPEDTIIKLDADLLFPFNEGKLRKEADAPLNDAAKKIRRMLQKDDWIRFEGYTDNRGSDKYNQRLSEQRAGAVASWFVEHGVVPMSRVRTEGYGKTMARANDEEGRKKDRRVDIWLPQHGGTKTVCR